MRNKKTIGIIFLLIVLTVAVVLIPQLVSNKREAKRRNEITYRDYKASERTMLTSDQVARLLYNRQIDTGSDLRIVDGKGDDAEMIRKEAVSLLDRLFGKGTDLSEPFNKRIGESTLSSYRSSCLILVENHPTALNFVNCCIKENDFFCEITYEEKTETLLAFSAETTMQFQNAGEKEQYSTMVESEIRAFFEENLGLGQDEYYCLVNIAENVSVHCEILRADEKGSDKN